MKLALMGIGRMGSAVQVLAPERGHQIVAWLDSQSHQDGLDMTALLASEAEVAIDFSVPDAVVDNVRAATNVGLDVVVGTTGWDDRMDEVRDIVSASGRGLVFAPNFALGVHAFFHIARAAARLAERMEDYDLHVTEMHHRHKLDHPSGTARRLIDLVLEEVSRKERWAETSDSTPGDSRVLNVAVTRAGELPGTHVLGLDSADDRIEIRHEARGRAGFARGAIQAAEWVRGRTGVFTIEDLMADRLTGLPPAEEIRE